MTFEFAYERQLPARRPDGHRGAPRNSVRWQTPRSTLVSVYFGMQGPSAQPMEWADAKAFTDRIRGFLAEADGPEAHEVMRCADEAGLDNVIVVAYWTQPGRYARWAERSGFRAWFESPERLAGDTGHWCESLLVPYDRHETIFSHPDYRIGLARTEGAGLVPIQTGGYFGAARDRVPLSAIDPLEAPGGGVLPAARSVGSRGRHLCAAVPHNATVLRSGQYWEGAGQEQLDDYLQSLQPKMLRGMAHIVADRATTGCLSLRIMTNLNEDGSPRAETSVYAMFLSLDQLEAWSASHQTHLDIYRHAVETGRKYREKREVVTWHELFVLHMGNVFEYVNCHPKTGILPFARWSEPVGG